MSPPEVSGGVYVVDETTDSIADRKGKKFNLSL